MPPPPARSRLRLALPWLSHRDTGQLREIEQRASARERPHPRRRDWCARR
jgi:hypothetical protein